jgi:hypothetical protein
MKSTSSSNQKSQAKPKTQKRKAEGSRPKSSSGPRNPFQDLTAESASLLNPLLATIESELKIRGLDPTEIRSLDSSGTQFHMTVNHTISVMISVFTSENREHLHFSIHADLGRARRVPERAFLLEALLGINLGTRDPFRLALTQNDCIRLVYSARVFDQMNINTVGALLDQLVSRATSFRNQLSGQPMFQELGTRDTDEAEDKTNSIQDSKGPNGWVQ